MSLRLHREIVGYETTVLNALGSLKRLQAIAKIVHSMRTWMLLKGFRKKNNMTDLYKFWGLKYDIVLK